MLTKKQTKVLNFVKKYIKKNGIAPSRGEIAEEFDMWPQAAQDHLVLIEKKGYIRLIPRVARGIVIKQEK